jgi:hypothetical protein
MRIILHAFLFFDERRKEKEEAKHEDTEAGTGKKILVPSCLCV